MNFSPYSNNIIDYLDQALISGDGRSVIVKRAGMMFLIYVNDSLYRETSDNLVASYILNSLDCNLESKKGGVG